MRDADKLYTSEEFLLDREPTGSVGEDHGRGEALDEEVIRFKAVAARRLKP
jgi:hypothetical protein